MASASTQASEQNQSPSTVKPSLPTLTRRSGRQRRQDSREQRAITFGFGGLLIAADMEPQRHLGFGEILARGNRRQGFAPTGSTDHAALLRFAGARRLGRRLR